MTAAHQSTETVVAAFADGRLRILVDEPRRFDPYRMDIAAPAKWDGNGALVHVISKPAGGEIRGYMLIDGKLHLRKSGAYFEWAELDAEVAKQLGAEVLS